MSITPNNPADFTPDRGNYTTLKPFRFWCQKVLPLVYDDSLSYYELLCKVVDFLNKTMEDVETLEDDVTSMYTAFDELQSYVNTYFSELDVQEEIDNKLDTMAESGALTELIEPLLPSLISTWLSENIEPTTPPIDRTLTIENAAADAKVVGDTFKRAIVGEVNIINEIDDITNLPVNQTFKIGRTVGTEQGLPKSGYGTLMKYAPDATKNFCVYIYVTYGSGTSITGEMYYAICYSDTTKANIQWFEVTKRDEFLSTISNFISSNPTIINNVADITTLDSNKIYAIASGYGASQGLPVNGYGTLFKYSPTINNNFCVYLYNVYAGAGTGKMYYAITYSDATKDTIAWIELANNAEVSPVIANTIQTRQQIVNNVADITTLDVNKIYAIGTQMGTDQGLPERGYGTLVKYSPLNSNNFCVYLYNVYNVTESGGLYYAITYSDTTKDNISWIKVDTEHKTKWSIAPTDDVIGVLTSAYNDYTTDIFFEAGEYDIIALYQDHFGSDYFTNYTSNYNNNLWGRGIPLGKNIHYHFSDKAIFKCNYTGSNTNVTNFFSMFASDLTKNGAFVCDGLKITKCNNVRYAVHNDFGVDAPSGAIAEYRNCYFNCNCRPLGVGIRNGDILVIDSCIFNTTDTNDVNIHTPNNVNNYGKAIIKNSYFDKVIALTTGSVSNVNNCLALITGNSLASETTNTDKWDVIKFNNVIR